MHNTFYHIKSSSRLFKAILLFFSLFILTFSSVLHAQNVHTANTSYEEIFFSKTKGLKLEFIECIDADNKWDFATSTCLSGRHWTYASAEMLKELDRPLTDSEKQEAISFMKIKSPQTVARTAQAHAIIIIGAGGSGKTFMSEHLDKWLDNFNLENYILFDGDIIRKFHSGFLDAVSDPLVGYLDAWPTIKPHIFETKDQMMDQIIKERRNIVIPTGIKGEEYFNLMLQHDYKITIIGVYVDFETAFYRGKNRGEWTGRRYIGTHADWSLGVEHMISLSMRPEVAQSFILDNNDFYNPEVLYSKNWNLPTGALTSIGESL